MADNKPGSKLIKAAGGVAWRPGPDGEPEILLVHRKRYDDWSLPKGKTEPGELLPVTAVREVLEEGGARLALGRRLISVRYQVGGRPKRVHYWAARVASLDDRAVPNDEVDQVKWVDAAHAVEHVSYTHDHGVLADFARLPVQTVPVILLRHAKAVHKASWKHADARRPLDDSGRADAKALAELLDCFAPSAGFAPRARLITSPAARCVETLRPFAELSGAQLREEPSLYVHHQLSASGRGRLSPVHCRPGQRGDRRGRAGDPVRPPGEHPRPPGRRPGRPGHRPARLRRGPRQRAGQRGAGPHRRAPQGLGRRPPHLRVLGAEPSPRPSASSAPSTSSAPLAPSRASAASSPPSPRSGVDGSPSAAARIPAASRPALPAPASPRPATAPSAAPRLISADRYDLSEP